MTATSDLIQKLYIGYFGRAGDPSGLQYWVERKTAGMSDAAIAQSFSVQTEATSMYGYLAAPSLGMGQDAFLESVYQNLFERSIEAGGLTYWKGQLASGRPVGSIILDIINGATGSDATTVANKLSVANYYTEKVISTNATWTLADDQADAIAVIANVTSADATVTTGRALADTLVAADLVPAGQTFTLTTGVDPISTMTGTAGNDTFNAVEVVVNGNLVNTWSAGDAIVGGAGTDTFNVTQTGAVTIPLGATVTGVERMNVLSTTTGTSLNTTTFTGLEALNITAPGNVTARAAATTAMTVTNAALAAGQTVAIDGGSTVTATTTAGVAAIGANPAGAGTVTVGAAAAAAGAVVVNTTSTLADGVGGTIGVGTVVNVTGGTSVAVNNTLATTGASDNVLDAVLGGAVNVTGNASTTTVSVTQTAAREQAGTGAAIVNGGVTITDAGVAGATADTIATVTLANYGASTVTSSALSTLNLTGGTVASGALTLDAQGTVSPATTLALNLNGGSLGAIGGTQAAAYTTLNVAGATAASTLANFTSAGVTALNVSGNQAVTFTSNAGLTNLATVTSTNTAGVTLGSALAATTAFTGGAGNDTITLGALHNRNVDMGAGNDIVTYGGALNANTLRVAAGDGTDTIVMTASQAATASATAVFNTTFNGFETLRVIAGANPDNNQIVNLAGINSVNNVVARGSAAGDALTLNGFQQNGTLTLDTAAAGATSGYTAGITNANLNAADVFNVRLSNDGAARTFGTVTVAQTETVNISTIDAGTGAANTAATVDVLTLAATGATTITVAGNNGLNLTNANNGAVTRFDASGVVGDTANDTIANLGVTFASATTTAGATVTIIGGAGSDVLTGNNLRDVLTGNAGNDQLTGGLAQDTYNVGVGRDVIVVASDTNGGAAGSSDSTTAAADVVNGFTLSGAITAANNLALATANNNAGVIANFTNAASTGLGTNTSLLAFNMQNGVAGGPPAVPVNQAITIEANVTGAVGAAAGVTHTVTNGILTLGGNGASAVDTLGEWLIEANAIAATAGDVLAFVFGNSTYVFGQNDDADMLVELAGVTNAAAVALTGVNTAVAANSILLLDIA